MLHIELDESTGIAVVTPEGALSESDFTCVVQVIDPYIEKHGGLKGLVIYTKDFPGWNSFGALAKHLRFVKNHHRKLAHIALVTDSKLGLLADKVASHFIAAKVMHFRYSELDQAKVWITQDERAL